ncbi:angiopoietin-related protein 7-like [Argopecten irradians]|uniref:angiopoietin-related protein 7-like n=1 Tax=Argopecten irradians TaxID=31199 RepID=UPI00371B0462
MDTPDGPWTVIQNRESGEVDFYRSWADYKNGFGDLNGNFWLGNEAIHDLTTSASVLRIDLVPWLGDARYAEYSTFSVENEADDYRLTMSGFSGTVFHDAMSIHNGMRFSTFDDDNDVWGGGSCAVLRTGGWWYRSCYDANLNGAVYINGTEDFGSPIWNDFYKDGEWLVMMKTRMLVKRPQ